MGPAVGAAEALEGRALDRWPDPGADRCREIRVRKLVYKGTFWPSGDQRGARAMARSEVIRRTSVKKRSPTYTSLRAGAQPDEHELGGEVAARPHARWSAPPPHRRRAAAHCGRFVPVTVWPGPTGSRSGPLVTVHRDLVRAGHQGKSQVVHPAACHQAIASVGSERHAGQAFSSTRIVGIDPDRYGPGVSHHLHRADVALAEGRRAQTKDEKGQTKGVSA